MFTTEANLKGLSIHATDGEMGTLENCYFDDEAWTIRYLAVNTGGWLGGRDVLISPFSVRNIDWQSSHLNIALTKKQIENSPGIDTHRPVSREHEAEFLGYYGYPPYWNGPYLWGPALYPAGFETPDAAYAQAATKRIRSESPDSHLRSTGAVSGYSIEAADGEIGHVDGFIVDDRSWAIRYIEAATRNWWPGKKVLIAPDWIERVSWVDAQVRVALSREAIQSAPEYIEPALITRDFEDRLHRHYGRPPYWLRESKLAASAARR
jgi:hypothetical protein